MQSDIRSPPSNGTINKEYFITENTKYVIEEWRYEMRREMQQILPGLFLGPFTVCRASQHLKDQGISHILCLLDKNEQHLFQAAIVSPLFKFMVLTVNDSTNENLIPHFPHATAFINSAHQQGGKVLVCCTGGMSRSPSFVIAYIMEMYNLDAAEAYQYVQSRRLCINPNDSFKSQLNEYEPIYLARKYSDALPSSQQDMSQPFGRRRRRRGSGLEEEEEEANMSLSEFGKDLKRRTHSVTD